MIIVVKNNDDETQCQLFKSSSIKEKRWAQADDSCINIWSLINVCGFDDANKRKKLDDYVCSGQDHDQ